MVYARFYESAYAVITSVYTPLYTHPYLLHTALSGSPGRDRERIETGECQDLSRPRPAGNIDVAAHVCERRSLA